LDGGNGGISASSSLAADLLVAVAIVAVFVLSADRRTVDLLSSRPVLVWTLFS
jgi:hypothetical protein